MVQIKEELCVFLTLKNHPGFEILFHNIRNKSNLMDPCPLMVIFTLTLLCALQIFYLLFNLPKGHRYMKSTASDYSKLPPLLPVGEWRIDTIISRSKTDSSDLVFRFHDYYEVSAKGALQF